MVGSVAELLAALLSPEVETVTLLLTFPGIVGDTVSIMVLLELAAIGPLLVQVTICPAGEQLQPPPVPETYVNPAGSVSVTVISPVVGPEPTF